MNNRKRNAGEINAGSMADIAFLLLIFFLVVTTMDKDMGILRTLPPPIADDSDPVPVHGKNVLQIFANANNELLVEEEKHTLESLSLTTTQFLTNTDASADMPLRTLVTLDSCKRAIAYYEALEAQQPGGNTAKLRKAQSNLETVQLVGAYYGISDQAVIVFDNDPKTNYSFYIQIQDNIESSIAELRNNFCRDHFQCNYADLQSENPLHHPKIKAARTVYPQRIVEAKDAI